MIYISKLFSPISTGTSAGDIDVGATVKIDENGQPVDYLVVHQGLPSDIYDFSCEGTWCLRKDIAENRAWNSSGGNDYENSSTNGYLNGNWLTRYDADVQEAIVQCKIPYRPGSGTSTTVSSGSNGLSVKAFLLSSAELGFNFSNRPVNEGAELSYFSGCADNGPDSKRIAYRNGSPDVWGTRTPVCVPGAGSDRLTGINESGGSYVGYAYNYFGLRPCIILPYDFVFQKSEVS